MAIQISDIKIVPDPLKRGAMLKGSCKVISDVEIDAVYALDPEGGYYALFDDGTHGDEVAGDGIYTREEYLPYEVPSGSYTLTIVARDKKGNSERKTVTVSVE